MIWLKFALILLPLFLVVFNQTIDNNNFGPYKVNWEHFKTCKGPKQKDCGKVTLENTQNMSDVIFVLDFPKDCPVTKAKVTIGTKQTNSTIKKLWNYALDTPCQHFVLGPILVDSFNLTNNCKINKGHYDIHLNMTEKSTMFLGSKFFYGNYNFKVIAHNKNSNFFCFDSLMAVEKRGP